MKDSELIGINTRFDTSDGRPIELLLEIVTEFFEQLSADKNLRLVRDSEFAEAFIKFAVDLMRDNKGGALTEEFLRTEIMRNKLFDMETRQ